MSDDRKSAVFLSYARDDTAAARRIAEVLRAGKKVRVAVELADTQTGRQLSSNRCEQELADIFSIQAAIAEEVAKTLKATRTAERCSAQFPAEHVPSSPF